MYADRKWRQVAVGAMITAGVSSSITAELNPAWTAKGQHWRIEREIRAAIDGATDTAQRARDDIADLRHRISEANRRISEPFPHAAELETARNRRDDIEQQIRDAATPPEETGDADGTPGKAEAAARADLGLASEAAWPEPAVAGDDDREEYTIIPVTTWPEATSANDNPADPGQVVTLTAPPPLDEAAVEGDQVVILTAPSLPGEAEASPALPVPFLFDEAEADADPAFTLPVSPLPDEAVTDFGPALTAAAAPPPDHPLDAPGDQPGVLAEPVPGDHVVSGEPQPGQALSPAASAAPSGEPPPATGTSPAPRRTTTHPALLARLDDADDTLFPELPMPAAGHHNGQAPQPKRPARPRGARRATPSDGVVQPTLFDLPEPSAAEPARNSTPERRSSARRR
jgi:hypothetical protein